ncbi:hypothetical protein [Bacillus sp. FJAT-50079]|uniref:hypothetical protein n=1 Tax=Bacillus sp. FJAT-50079 TaxID=2833577 RepID=UPI001BC9596C|nr:hypothetical protein [Bacillus sp. FJAT-50079]MBS4209026.1 hypothetical protein [Bacillus sp. FJAT-50079]
MWISFLLFILMGLLFLNIIAFKFSKTRHKRIFMGVLILFLAPVLFFATFSIVIPYDTGGFGTAMYSILYTALFLLNGIVITAIGVFTKRKEI